MCLIFSSYCVDHVQVTQNMWVFKLSKLPWRRFTSLWYMTPCWLVKSQTHMLWRWWRQSLPKHG